MKHLDIDCFGHEFGKHSARSARQSASIALIPAIFLWIDK